MNAGVCFIRFCLEGVWFVCVCVCVCDVSDPERKSLHFGVIFHEINFFSFFWKVKNILLAAGFSSFLDFLFDLTSLITTIVTNFTPPE